MQYLNHIKLDFWVGLWKNVDSGFSHTNLG